MFARNDAIDSTVRFDAASETNDQELGSARSHRSVGTLVPVTSPEWHLEWKRGHSTNCNDAHTDRTAVV
ncbi:hypothetical protein D8Y22_06060 [Salinadaptatus halalkaliphilus]|uniref:Uncharacterized protein n=1 Tax=Salinadaptatus halalkaliphilus TaxID=2419781 RepID=A0A4S3TN99_9EURY|nr:hypothetical protein D8Y22_06060 [Salinadaptatus halalkaliphilus]